MSHISSSSIRDKKKRKKAAAKKSAATGVMLLDAPQLPKPTLDEKEIEFFIKEGYLVIENAASTETNNKIIKDSDEALIQAGFIEGTRNHSAIGNNIAPAVPELLPIVMNPNYNKVSGALATLLGSDYVLHKHLTGMNNDPGSRPQNVHKDNFAGFNMRRSHAPWWCMVMYYPQDTTISLAATSIIARTQYLHPEGGVDERHLQREKLKPYLKIWNTSEQQMEVKAGSCVIVHKDIFHRGMANTDSKRRWMFKYEVLRQSFPRSSSIPPPTPVDRSPLASIHSHIRNWIYGFVPSEMPTPPPCSRPLNKLALLGATCDVVRLQSAYTLSVSELLNLLSNPTFHDDEMAVRSVRHGLSASLYYCKNEDHIEKLLSLIEIAKDVRPLIAASCLLAIGESGGILTETVAHMVGDYIIKLIFNNPPRVNKSGQHNVLSHSVLTLGLLGTIYDSVRVKARSAVCSILETAAGQVNNINGNPSKLPLGEFYMETAFACVRLTNQNDTDDKYLSSISNLSLKIARIEISNAFPRLPGKGGGAGADQGLRYTMAWLMSALAKSCNATHITKCYQSLQVLGRVGRAVPDERSALVNRWCHFTDYNNGF